MWLNKDSVNSFGARDTLDVGDKSYQIYRIRHPVPIPRNSPTALKSSPKTCCARRTAATSPRTTSRPSRTGIQRRNPGIEMQVHARPRRDAGLHRRALHGRLATMRRPWATCGGKGRPARRTDLVIAAGDRRVVRHRRFRAQRRDRVRAQRGALPVPALGARRFPGLQGGATGTGIVHQVNIEYLASVVMERDGSGTITAYPGHLCGEFHSHTTMVNGLGARGGAWAASRPRPPCSAHPYRC